MTFLPVVERELRVAARRRATYFVRLVAAAVALICAAWVLIVDRNSSQAAGVDLFRTLAILLFLYAGILGTQVTADCISEEKREGTLGLLFLTDLKGYDVVFGKLVATSIHWFYGMLAVVPVLAIPLLLGGVSRGELWRVVVVLVNLLFFSLSIGLFASTICRRDVRAHALAVLLALAVLFTWPVASIFMKDSSANLRIADLFTPITGCLLAFDNVYPKPQSGYFWINFDITQFLSWIFLALACWNTPRCWQDGVVGKSSWWRGARPSSGRPERRTKLLALNPFLWRASRSTLGRLAVWLFLAVAAGIWAWQYLALHRGGGGGDEIDPPVNIAFLMVCGLVVKGWVAVESGRALNQDRRSGALELILSTQLRPDEIVRGQLRALWRQFALPIAVLLAANAIFLMQEWRLLNKWPLDADDRLSVIWIHIVIGMFLATDAIALSWVGMWHAFVGRNPIRSAVPALFRVIVAPVLVFFLLMWILTISNANPNRVDAFVFWCGLAATADVFAVLSGQKLLTRFQMIASEGYTRGPSPRPPSKIVPKLVETS